MDAIFVLLSLYMTPHMVSFQFVFIWLKDILYKTQILLIFWCLIVELLNFHLGYHGNSVIIADRYSMHQSTLSTNIYPLSNPRDPDSVKLSWRQDFCIEIYGH